MCGGTGRRIRPDRNARSTSTAGDFEGSRRRLLLAPRSSVVLLRPIQRKVSPKNIKTRQIVFSFGHCSKKTLRPLHYRIVTALLNIDTQPAVLFPDCSPWSFWDLTVSNLLCGE